MPDCAAASVHADKKNDVHKIPNWQPTSRRNAASDARRSDDAPHDAFTQRDRLRFRAAIAEVTERQLKVATADPAHHKKTTIPFA
jgi:hypothetical protein